MPVARRIPGFPLLPALVLAFAPLAHADDGQDADWNWVVAPYLWASSVGTDLRGDAPPVGSQVEFRDVLSKLDMALQIHAEGQGDRFGAFANLTYLSLSDGQEFPGVATEMSLDASMFEVAGVWNVAPERFAGLDLFAGIRRIDADGDVRFDPDAPALPAVDVGLAGTFTDAMVGGRYTARLADRWRLVTQLDGAWGGTEGAFNGSLKLAYSTGKGSWIVGYRYFQTELEDGGVDLELSMSGPVIAYAFGLQ